MKVSSLRSSWKTGILFRVKAAFQLFAYTETALANCGVEAGVACLFFFQSDVLAPALEEWAAPSCECGVSLFAYMATALGKCGVDAAVECVFLLAYM